MTKVQLATRLAYILMFAAIFDFTGHRAYGQGTGQIKGVVTDSSGALVPGATVTAISGETGTSRSTVTGSDGSFLISLLEPQHYAVHVKAETFEEMVRGPITVKVTETADLGTLPLTAGTSETVVTVTEQEGLLQNENATLGKVFDSKAIEAMPLSTRNFSQLLSLQAGVIGPIPTTLVLGNGTTQFSVGGGRVYDNSITIDGINAVSSSSTGSFPVPSPDALDEFKVQTSNYSAQFGRAGGGNIAVTTKGGTSHFHGDGFYFLRNKALDANDYFLKQSQAANGEPNIAPDLKQNQYGGTVGGPAIRNKSFFFFSYQSTKQSNGNAGLIDNPAYPYLPAGDRSNGSAYAALLGACYGGETGLLGGTAVATNGSNINPVAIGLLQAKNADGSYVLPSFPRQDLPTQPCTSHAIFNIVPTYTENQYLGTLDYNLTSQQLLTVKFFDAHNQYDSDNASVPGFHSITPGVNDLASLKHTFVITPTVVNELLVGYMRQDTNGHETVPAGLSARSTGMAAAPDSQGYFPQWVMINNGVTIPGRSLARNAENQYSISDSVSDVIGRHVLHLGGVAMDHQLTLDSSGTWGSGAIITYGAADFLLGLNGTQNGSGVSNLLVTAGNTGLFRKDYRFNDYGFFVQDDWQFLSKVTLNLGLRWDYYAWPSEQKSRLDNFDRSLIGEGLFGIPTTAQAYTGYTIAQGFIDKNPNFAIPAGVTAVNNQDGATPNYKNFAPRVGFAWTPAAKLDVRGGFGLFFSRTSSVLAQSLITGPPFNNSDLYSFGPAGTEQDPFTHLGLPPDSAFPNWPARTYSPTATPSLLFNAVTDKLGNPYTEQWNLSVQRQLGKDYLFELAYQGQNGVKLLQALSQNQAVVASVSNPIRGITTNSQGAQNIQARSPVAGILSDEGLSVSQTNASSHFNALEATLDKRFSHGLQFISAFTWSRSEDSNSIGLGAIGSGAVPPNDNNTTHHMSLSGFDRTLRFTTSAVYEIPNPIKNPSSFFTGALGHSLSGWGMAGVLVAQTGPPTSFSLLGSTCACSDIKLQGGLTASIVPGKTLQDVMGSGKTSNRLTNYFNTGVLQNPSPTGFGTTPTYTSIRQPGQKSVDFSLTKNTSIHEKYKLEFRSDFFNFFNWASFAAADSTPTTRPSAI